jgi:uncharacterized protein
VRHFAGNKNLSIDLNFSNVVACRLPHSASRLAFAKGPCYDNDRISTKSEEVAVKLDHIQRSDHVDDVRGQGGGFGGGLSAPRGRGGIRTGGLGIGTLVILGILGWLLGIDPRILLGGAEMLGGGSQQVSRQQQPVQLPETPANDEVGIFVSKVLRLNEDVWTRVLPMQTGVNFEKPRLTLFSGYTTSECGAAQSAMGPFYCPLDQRVYLDAVFFTEMKRRLGGGGDFAYAYVISHEVGHHIENLLGILPKVQAMQRRVDKVQANDLSVRVELMADCLGGVWAHHAEAQYKVLEPGDIEEALRTAQAIGDDMLQRKSQGYVVPDSFTHGSAEQRQRWLTIGLKGGDVNQCNTFEAQQL